MAAVDRFELLLREIFHYFSHIRDSFAILGAVYAARKTLKTSWSLLNALNVHFLSRLSQKCNLTEKFGEWAGMYFTIQLFMLLIHKDISHMPITELENDSESIWVKVFANKTSHFVASWYRPPGGDLEKLDSQLKSLRSQLEKIKDIHKGNKPPSVHILGDFNFCDIVWPDRLSKSGSPLSPSEGEKFIEILNDHHLEQLVHFPTREKNTLDLIITSLPTQFLDIQSPDRLSDHDIVSGTLKIVIPPIKKPRRKVYRYQKGDYESMRSDALKFAKERYFNGYSDTRSVQENFNLITSFIQDSADKHIPSKTSRSVSSVPWITPAIRRKIRRKNATHAKAKKSGSAKIRAKFETLRREIKADIRKQHDLYVNNLVGDVKANPKDFYRYINSQKKDAQGIPPLKKRNGGGVAQSESEKAAEFNGQFTDVFTKSEYSQVPLLDRSAPFMEDIVVTKEGVTKLLKGLNPSKALGPDELHPRVLKELATELGPIFAHLFQQSIDSGDIPKAVKGITSTSYFSVHFKNTTFWMMEGKFLCSGDSLGLADFLR